jgi:hypothetical protein
MIRNTETRYIDCKALNIPGTLKGTKEVLDGWLQQGKSGRSLVILDDLHCVAKTEVEVRAFCTIRSD